MNSCKTIVGFILAVALVGALSFAQQKPATPPAPKVIKPLGGNMHRDMEAMGDAYERLEKQISDASKNASSLELIARMQQLTAGVKHLPPPGVQKLPEAERAAKLLEFRKQMLGLLRAELDVEEHLLANDNEKAAQAVQQMSTLATKGHEEFQPKHEDHGGDNHKPAKPG